MAYIRPEKDLRKRSEVNRIDGSDYNWSSVAVFTGVIHHFIPAVVLPGGVPRVLSGLKVLIC